jgi:hypothetical protein
LFAVIIPLAGGALFALLLREVYARHPLPLGGTIVQEWWKTPKPVSNAAETPKPADPLLDEVKNSAENSVKSQVSAEPSAPDTNSAAASSVASPTPEGTSDPGLTDGLDELSMPLSSAVSVFDGTEKIPENLPIGSILESMTSKDSTAIPYDFERIIDESAQSTAAIPEDYTAVDEYNHDDLQELMNALPKTEIDFSQALEADEQVSGSVLPTAKEVLGEQFDFDALEQQANQTKQSLQLAASIDNLDLAGAALDIQEDAGGTVHVSSPFMSDASSQLADFTVSQNILPMFSNDWIQETSGTADTTGTGKDTSQFCFTEESRPMFVRKKKR